MIDREQLVEALAALQLVMLQDGYGSDPAWLKVKAAARAWLDQGDALVTRWICLVDDEFSCNGYLAEAIEDKSIHEPCGEFRLVKISPSPALSDRSDTQ